MSGGMSFYEQVNGNQLINTIDLFVSSLYLADVEKKTYIDVLAVNGLHAAHNFVLLHIERLNGSLLVQS